MDECGKPKYQEVPEHLIREGSLAVKPMKHRQSRRAFFHDYCSPGYYMITATLQSGDAILSKLPDLPLNALKKDKMIIPANTPLGDAIMKEINDLPQYHPEISILRFVIMPDHIHMVLQVNARLKRKLGLELAGFFGACSKHNQQINGAAPGTPLFTPFHDRIILNFLQLDRAIKYVEDNPRRLLIKRNFPDLFRRYLHLEIDGHEYAAYGNIFLLKEIYLLQIRIHRRWSNQEFADYKRECLSEISKGAIPISPAIHQAEKDILNEAIKMGRGVILLSDQGFEDRFKPKGKLFDLCAEGRLLLLAPWPENTGRKSTSGYTEFHQMNDFALSIARLPAEARLSIKKQ